MRKKSHVSLAKHIISECCPENEISHTGAFKLGSLVPDLVPTFITKKHQIDATFDIIEKKVYKVLDTYDVDKGLTKIHTKDLGVITHYIADYFTFPHNAEYPGSLKDHMTYEKTLIEALNSYVASIDVDAPMNRAGLLFLKTCRAPEDVFRYILHAHAEYVRSAPNVEVDCEHIVRVCNNVVTAILTLLMQKRQYQVALA